MPVPGGALTKPELRRRLLRARAALPAERRAQGDAARTALLLPLLAGRTVASYEPFGTEPVPPAVPDALLPVLLPDRDLSWRRDGRDLGPDAVAAAEVLLVPGLAGDASGARLGRGGGSYDRALARARGLVVLLLHEGELLDHVPVEPHDVRVHVLALPSGLVSASGTIAP